MYDSCSEGRKGPARLRLYLNPLLMKMFLRCAQSVPQERREAHELSTVLTYFLQELSIVLLRAVFAALMEDWEQ